MTTEVTEVKKDSALPALDDAKEILAKIFLTGGIQKLSPTQQWSYVVQLCDRLGLDPYTRPFMILHNRDGSQHLYALKACAEQLRRRFNVSLRISMAGVEHINDQPLYKVIAQAMLPDGRLEEDIGLVSLCDGQGKLLTGEALANAMLKCMTKAKRRATLSLLGLGMLDETEVEDIPGAKTSHVPMLVESVQAAEVTVQETADELGVGGFTSLLDTLRASTPSRDALKKMLRLLDISWEPDWDKPKSDTLVLVALLKKLGVKFEREEKSDKAVTGLTHDVYSRVLEVIGYGNS